MPQNTNLNVSPYFDDFDPLKNYQRVLFKPGYPIQSRELTTLQSILQNQIEKFGQHFFKEGSVVIPGQVAYDSEYTSVQINDTHLGIPVSSYIDKLVGKKIKGETSGVVAKVENYITGVESERSNYTLYVKYLSSSDTDFTTTTFLDGENLITLETIDYSLTSIVANTTFATTIISESTSTGSAIKIVEGIYFIRGFFITVPSQTVILDQYSNSPSYRIGLLINEEFSVASNNNDDLFDNAQGFSNFAAPGADRLKITTTLIKKELEDFNDEDFVELVRIENGEIKKFVNTTNYNLIRDELAKRTYDESGDYYIKPFVASIKESLNDRVGNNGIYLEGLKTKQGNTASDDLACISISPGKAYVRGYGIETVSNELIDLQKPRTTNKVINSALPFNIGRQITINNVYGSVPVGFSTLSTVYLYSDRTTTPGVSSGEMIGVANVYDLKSKSSEYANQTTEYEISLYDVQTYTLLTLNANIQTLAESTFVEGTSSGATGYLVSTISNSNILTLYQVSGSFLPNESLKFNGVDDGRIVVSIKDYNLSDVHQFVGNSGVSGVGTFTADPVLSNRIVLGELAAQFTITGASGGTSNVSTSSTIFYSTVNVGDIITYTKQGQTVPTYNKVSSVNDYSYLTIIPTTSVSGVSSGGLPTSTIVVNDLRKATLEIQKTSNAYLYSKLENSNVSNVDLTGSSIIFKKSYDLSSGDISSGSVSKTLETDLDLTLEPFDEEDYTLTYKNTGKVEPLNDQKVSISGRTISISGLTGSGPATLTATFKKINTKNKKKVYNRSTSLIVSRSNSTSSGIGKSTLDDGLVYSSIYGVRVQDKTISLNIPDVVSITGIFESSDTSDPKLPVLTLTSLNSALTNAVKGERIIGKTSNAVATYVNRLDANQLELVYLNENTFRSGEVVVFEESKISGEVLDITVGDKNIKSSYTLDSGYRSEYLDFSRIIRKEDSASPTKKIRIIFNNYTLNAEDNGDFVTVNSYDKERFKNDILSVDGYRSTDVIDLRPRVLPYSGTYSPFEYRSRQFSTSSNSSPHIFSQDRFINLSYDYYLPRIDKLFLSKDGIFTLNSGVPSINPKSPDNLDYALEIATLYLPPYLYDVKDVKINFTTHKRYTMKDISRLEDRISNIEYYTSLSLLESDTQNLVIRDPQTGLDRFKAGFFVDNFKSNSGGDLSSPIYKASVDTALGMLRPQHYTTSVDLLLGSESIVGIGTTSNPSVDLRFANDLGSLNIKRTGDIISLNYSDVKYIENKFATRIENVNPFLVTTWIGSLELNPSTDTWIETRRTERTEDIEGTYRTAMQLLGVDSNTGLSPVDWGAWETNWTGTTTVAGPSLGRINVGSQLTSTNWFGWGVTQNFRDTIIDVRNETTTTTTNQSRQGIQFGVSERFDSTSLGDRVVSRSIISLMRSRNIEVIARRLKPNTRFYGFFDNVDMTEYIVPKLIEVTMSSGTFAKGETVVGVLGSKTIRFRLANQNHKYGPYNAPIEVYKTNPYQPENSLSTNYSSTTTVLNVDTASLELQANSEFFGSISANMKLVGETSGAIATVSQIRLITDNAGVFIGSLFIPDPTTPSTPSFKTGTKTFVLTSSSTNSSIVGFTQSTAENNFTSSGTLDNVEELTLRIRNADVERIPRSESRVVTSVESGLEVAAITENRSVTTIFPPPPRRIDPLAQSFEVTDPNGVFVTKCDVYFRSKSSNDIPVVLQIRTMQTGLPTQTILPFSEVTLDSDNVKVSEDGTVSTTFTFPSPVYLESGNEYSLVLLSYSDEYTVWISRMGEVDVSTLDLPESERIIVSQQPLLGSLFKSQNASTWDASQYEDLKFTLYRAEFSRTGGSVRFYNPDLGIGNRQVASLRPNPITAYSRSAVIGLGKSLSSADSVLFTNGSTITQENNTNFSGNLKSVLGAVGVGSTLSITNSGTGFVGFLTTYSNVDLVTLTGSGSGAKASITVFNGVAIAATVSKGGSGYAVGDTLTIDSENTGNFGKNLILSIPNKVGVISAYNSIIVDNIQGTISINNTDDIIVGVNTISGAYVSSNQIISDGLHFKVFHNNHGMYAANNRVTISGIDPDVAPVKLTANITATSTTINVNSVGIFTSFEGLPVDVSNPGYIIINNEIIGYTSYDLASNTISGISGLRGLDGSTINSHITNDNVFKYEFNGVSLRRINNSHLLSNTDTTKYPTEMDSYHVKIDMSKNGKDRLAINQLYFNNTKSGGTYSSQNVQVNSITGPKATQNMVFNTIRPNVQTLLPSTTSIQSKVRTFSSTSINGSERSFVDKGFENISLNSNNLFNDSRMICSKINEINNLQNYPGNKSFTLEMFLSTGDTRVSPMIDLDRVNVITTMNRIDNPINNFSEDPRINQISDDPNSAIYVSKIVKLQKPSDNLKVIFDAYRHSTNEIRIAYRLFRSDTPSDQQLYELFPGYDNLDPIGNIINPSNNSGRSDRFIEPSNTSNDFGNYEYTAKNLPIFDGFQIKVIMTGTNQSYVPLIRDLRIIATI